MKLIFATRLSPLKQCEHCQLASPWCLTVSALIEHFKIFRHSPIPICIVRLVPPVPLFQLVWVTTKFITLLTNTKMGTIPAISDGKTGKEDAFVILVHGWHIVTGSSRCSRCQANAHISLPSPRPVTSHISLLHSSSSKCHENWQCLSFSGFPACPELVIMSH